MYNVEHEVVPFLFNRYIVLDVHLGHQDSREHTQNITILNRNKILDFRHVSHVYCKLPVLVHGHVVLYALLDPRVVLKRFQ